MRKAQLVFEFIIAAIIFIGIVMYILWLLNLNVETTAENAIQEDLNYKAVQISDLLVKSKGNWSPSNTPYSIGIASNDGWPVLDSSKLQYLKNWCALQPADVKEKFDLGNKKIRVFINNTVSASPTTEWECGTDAPKNSGYIKRYALISGSVSTVEVWVGY